MHVIATAGHVDHGKSTLVRALTGQEPDRLSEEHRRGLSIELGYCWTDLPGVGPVAFVDVPGHERFVSTMLAGVGPVPAVLLVVAADDPWMPQAAEHLAALDALGVRHGVVAVTRCDVADPGPMVSEVGARLRGTTLQDSAVVPVSARSGVGLEALRTSLAHLLARLPAPDHAGDVRLWVDRRFVRPGAGTIVTGTLSAGRIQVGDRLEHGTTLLWVRAVQSLGRPTDEVTAVARVALRLGGDIESSLDRGSALLTPQAWLMTSVVDARVARAQPSEATADRSAAVGNSPQATNTSDPVNAARVPERPLLYIGSASVAVRVRAMGADVVRLRLDRPIPLRVGDTALLRDPGSRRVWRIQMLDPLPPPLERRGSARRRAEELSTSDGVPDLADELRRRRVVRSDQLRLIGVPSDAAAARDVAVSADGWLLDRTRLPELRRRLHGLVQEHLEADPLQRGVAAGAAAHALGLPTGALLRYVVEPPLRLVDGLVRSTGTGGEQLSPLVEAAVEAVESELTQNPFAAPSVDRLVELGLDGRALGAAVRAGRLVKITESVVLLPGSEAAAAAILSSLPQPFSASEARDALQTTRRVVVPLLELLDRRRTTRRLTDDRREIVAVDPRHDA